MKDYRKRLLEHKFKVARKNKRRHLSSQNTLKIVVNASLFGKEKKLVEGAGPRVGRGSKAELTGRTTSSGAKLKADNS